MKKTNLKGKSILVISHVYTTVPVEDLKEYLLKQSLEYLLYIKHPLFFKHDLAGSAYYLYKSGKLIEKQETRNTNLPSIVKYILDIFLSIYWVIKIGKRYDITVCLDNLNTLTGLLLKITYRVNKVIFYTIDYIPVRFSNHILNFLYHLIDKIAVYYSDKTWVLTQRMIEARKKLHNIDNKNEKQIIIPIGVWFNRIKRKEYRSIRKNVLIYAGGLLPHQGVQLMIEALPLIKKEVKDITFEIIGIGDYRAELEALVKKKKLNDSVSFLGYFPNHKDVEERLSTAAVGVGLYSKELDIWSYYADPSKMKSYLVAGLPVITTDVTYFSQIVEEKHCGVVVNYTKEDVAKKTISLLKDRKTHEKMRRNAIQLAKELDWQLLFDKGFASLNL